MRLLIFCEAGADFRTAGTLVDRVLHDEGPAWVADLLKTYPASVREWVGDGNGNDYFNVHYLDEYRRDLKDVRFLQGHFDGKPGAAGAQMARNAFLIARALARRDASAALDAVLLVWDMDDQGDERRRGLEQARAEASRLASFRIVLGSPDRMREAWVLAGFKAESDAEGSRLDEIRRELGFCPCSEAHRLDAKDNLAPRSPKRRLGELTADDADREARCLTEAPLDRLRDRGEHSGLRAFLDEVKERLVPLCTRSS